MNHRLSQTLLALICLVAVIGAGVYLSHGLDKLGVVVTIVLAVCGAVAFFLNTPTEKTETQAALEKTDRLLLALYLGLLFYGAWQLFSNRSERALITPWEVVPPSHLIIYFVATLSLLFVGFRNRLRTPLISLHYLWTFSIALIVYRVGYGFDPFIHQATVKAIEEFGRIFPTTFYYLGQYSLVTSLYTLFGSTIAFWDKLLVPVLAAVTIPYALMRGLPALSKRSSGLITILLLALPFTMFFVTTPQNLAFVFLILILFLALRVKTKSDLMLIWLLAAASLVTQPIAGIPACLFAVIVSIDFLIKNTYHRRTAYVTALTLLTVLLPLAFLLFNLIGSGVSLSFGVPQLSFLSWLLPGSFSKESVWLNLGYLIGSSRGIIFIALAAIGIFSVIKQNKEKLIHRYPLPAAALLLAAVLTSTINFGFLIDYERSDYPQRIIFVAALFLLPFVIIGIDGFIEKLRATDRLTRLAFTVFLAGVITTSLYLSYPRFDHYHNSRGYATSKADILAVHFIENDAKGKDYVVLANQQSSAAALRELGFKKYYHGDIFFYPIPTGGPLYQHYLEMIKKPNRETIERAMELSGVDLAYFVISDYWRDVDKIGAEAKVIADDFKVINDGQAQVFRFSLQR